MSRTAPNYLPSARYARTLPLASRVPSTQNLTKSIDASRVWTWNHHLCDALSIVINYFAKHQRRWDAESSRIRLLAQPKQAEARVGRRRGRGESKPETAALFTPLERCPQSTGPPYVCRDGPEIDNGLVDRPVPSGTEGQPTTHLVGSSDRRGRSRRTSTDPSQRFVVGTLAHTPAASRQLPPRALKRVDLP
jgi:hypothetical protein